MRATLRLSRATFRRDGTFLKHLSQSQASCGRPTRPTLSGKPPCRNPARAWRLVRERWVRVAPISVFIEGTAMFGALAYVAADFNARFDTGLGLAGAMLAAFGAGALLFALSAGWLVPKLGQSGLRRQARCCPPVARAALAGILGRGSPPLACLGGGFTTLHSTLKVNATQMAPPAPGLSVSPFPFFLFMAPSLDAAPRRAGERPFRGPTGVRDGCHGPDLLASGFAHGCSSIALRVDVSRRRMR